MPLLQPPLDGPARLRELLRQNDVVVAPGCTDPLSARIAESAGFECIYMTGNGTSAVRLGRPDVGLMTLTEMVDQAGAIVDAVNVPLVADADTGYGNPLNVIRTVRAYERAGAAAFHLEDQSLPKRCGHLAGKQLIPTADHAAKISAAVEARSNPDTVIIGRTDAASLEGVDAAIARARAYGEAGADMLFVEGLATASDIERVASELGDWPLVHPWVEGRGEPLTPTELGGLGVRLVIYPITGVLTVLKALQRTYGHLREHGTPTAILDDLATFEEFSEFMGASDAAEVEQRFAVETRVRADRESTNERD